MDNKVIKQIEELFLSWYYKVFFDSTGTWGAEERKALIDYCKEHIEEFKEFAKDTLSNPQECCHQVASLCEELLPEISEEINPKISEEDAKKFMDELNDAKNDIEKLLNSHFYREYCIFNPCNIWLNYFKGTKGIDYYIDYVEYKEYLDKHYISWKPNEEDDPNPTYEEYMNNKEKYKI